LAGSPSSCSQPDGLTVSVGIAVLDRSRRALTELIGAADKALSEAKTTGHDKVCVLPGFARPAS
jgi:PleD family two-component response regulator